MAIDKQTRAEILRRFFAEKWKMGMIAHHLGVHHNTVDRIVTEGGVPPQFTGKPVAYRPGTSRPGTSDVKAMPVARSSIFTEKISAAIPRIRGSGSG